MSSHPGMQLHPSNVRRSLSSTAMASSYETSVSVSASPRTRGHDPRKREGLTARIAARTQALRQQIKSYMEDELSSHKIAVRIGGSPDGESTLRCIGGLVVRSRPVLKLSVETTVPDYPRTGTGVLVRLSQ